MIEKHTASHSSQNSPESRHYTSVDLSKALKMNKDNIKVEELELSDPELKDYLECRLCFEMFYSSEDKKAKSLSCGHVICKSCRDAYFKTSEEEKKRFHCPFCRAPLKWKKGSHEVWTVEDRTVKELSQTLGYKCPFHKIGCGWRSESVNGEEAVRSLAEHLKVCEHKKMLIAQIEWEKTQAAKKREARKREEARRRSKGSKVVKKKKIIKDNHRVSSQRGMKRSQNKQKFEEMSGDSEDEDLDEIKESEEKEPKTVEDSYQKAREVSKSQDNNRDPVELFIELMEEDGLIEYAALLDIYLSSDFMVIIKEVFGEDFDLHDLADMTLIEDLQGVFLERFGNSTEAFFRKKDLRKMYEKLTKESDEEGEDDEDHEDHEDDDDE